MKIALYCTNELALPLRTDVIYAPLPLFEALAIGLAEKGHKIFLYISADSKISHKNIQVMSHNLTSFEKAGYKNIWGKFADQDIVTIYDQFLAAQMLEDDKKYHFDIIHFYHMITRFLPLLKGTETAVVATLHDPLTDKIEFVLRACPWRNKIHYVSISDAQRAGFLDLPYAGTIHNGIDLSSYAFVEKPADYFVFFGRVSPEKGTHLAIQAALQAGVKLKIIGPDWGMFDYWRKEIEPHLGKKIEYLGQLPHKKALPIVAKARGLLFPIQWQEPFGLVMIEAMASGTPVIGFRKGSVPEVVKDRDTGFIVNSVPEMVRAIEKIDTIDRKKCREHTEAFFTMKKMVEEYEALYATVKEI